MQHYALDHLYGHFKAAEFHSLDLQMLHTLPNNGLASTWKSVSCFIIKWHGTSIYQVNSKPWQNTFAVSHLSKTATFYNRVNLNQFPRSPAFIQKSFANSESCRCVLLWLTRFYNRLVTIFLHNSTLPSEIHDPSFDAITNDTAQSPEQGPNCTNPLDAPPPHG